MAAGFEKFEVWVSNARKKIKPGGIDSADLDELTDILNVNWGRTLQRLLYLHATTPSIRSQVIGIALHEPVRGSVTEISTEGNEWPYRTVHDAILDGWQVIHFPDQRTPFDDREIDILGYEFILQKLEAPNE